MDADIEKMTREQLIVEVKRLRTGIREHRDSSDHAKVAMPLDDMFWGDRYGKLEDPSGHHWSVATHVRDVQPKELKEAAKTACG